MSSDALSTPLMATASANDPFYTMRDVCESEITSTRIEFDRWQGMLRSVDTSSDATFMNLHQELGKKLEKLSAIASRLVAAPVLVERNPARFPHVDARELATRKQLAAELQQRVANMKDTYMGRDTMAKLDADRRRQLHQRAQVEAEAASRRNNAYTAANEDFMNAQTQQQTQIRRQQDQSLDRISNTLDQLGDMARTINDEVRDQEQIITDVDREVDEAQGKMDAALKGIQKLLKTKDNCQLATICILVVVFIIVAVVAFYVLTS